MIRLAKQEDMPRLLEIYGAARNFMRQSGNPTQWANNYPGEDVLREDIRAGRLYGLEGPEGLCACFMLAPGPDITYDQIFDGAWASSLPYGVLHRIASDGSQKGVLRRCVAFAARYYSHLRFDTHRDNLPMQRALAREGFHYRGIILTHDGTPRLAYDRIQ